MALSSLISIAAALVLCLFEAECNVVAAFQSSPSYSMMLRRSANANPFDHYGAHLTCLDAIKTSRREYISNLIKCISTASIIAQSPTLPARATVVDNENNALVYNGVYTDPKHPKGYRILIGDTKTATLKLQDDPDGEVYTLPVQVEMNSDNDNTKSVKQFTFDFTAKGGPSNIAGTFTRDREGIPIITFPSDGNNAWKKRETGPIGVYQDGLDPKKLIVIRQLKGQELIVDIITTKSSRGDKTTTTIKAKAGNPTIMFDFPEGGVTGVFNLRKKIVSFEDGNVWTKF